MFNKLTRSLATEVDFFPLILSTLVNGLWRELWGVMVVNHSPKVADKDLRNFSPDDRDELFHSVKEKLSKMKKGNKTTDDDHFYVP